jgi:hypothetical protein
LTTKSAQLRVHAVAAMATDFWRLRLSMADQLDRMLKKAATTAVSRKYLQGENAAWQMVKVVLPVARTTG